MNNSNNAYDYDFEVTCEECGSGIHEKDYDSWDDKYKKHPLCDECYCTANRE